jgi:hypothetical protein
MRILTVAALIVALVQAVAGQLRNDIAARVATLTRETRWTAVSSVPIAFKTFHPQGLVKIGDTFFVSSVEVRVPTRRGPQPDPRHDRDAGEGVGHLFKIDSSGRRLADLTLGDGTMYHPGGIDYDGTFIWVTVAEYRPDSRSIVYRVDPETMTATEVLRVADHLGAVVHDSDAHALHGVSWGSRRFYRWTLDANGRVTNADEPLERIRTLNPSHYVDYQDCKYVGDRRMLCSGVTDLRLSAGSAPVRLGGLELIDLRDGRPVHQVPVPLQTAGGLAMTQNPSWFEATATGVRAYFMPEDDASTLYVFDASAK